MENIYGIPLVTSPFITPVPKLQISKDFEEYLEPEALEEFNAWLLDMFGTYSPIYILDGANRIAMHPDLAKEYNVGLGLIDTSKYL